MNQKDLLKMVMEIFDKTHYKRISYIKRIDFADRLAKIGDPRFENEEDLWVTIPNCRFMMGAQKTNYNRINFDRSAVRIHKLYHGKEMPIREIELSTFKIGKYPVTVHEYKKFVDVNGYDNEQYWNYGGYGMFYEPKDWSYQLQYLTRPVVYVSWYEAKAYANWKGCNLPSEAQWERTAKGYCKTYRKYSWGNTMPSRNKLNFDMNVGYQTPVGIFPEDCTVEGVYEMAGNVSEWCNDWFDEYSLIDLKNPKGPEDGIYKVIRGGNWKFKKEYCRSASRNCDYPNNRNSLVGIRLVTL